MMTQTTTTDPNATKARSLLQQGYVAYNNWEIEKARLLWRKAAVVDPANEEVWVALLDVSQDDDDRKVCLQNILVLNPNNDDMEQRLRLLESETQPTDVHAIEPQLEHFQVALDDRVQRWVSWVLSAILVLIVAVILSAMLIQPFI